MSKNSKKPMTFNLKVKTNAVISFDTKHLFFTL